MPSAIERIRERIGRGLRFHRLGRCGCSKEDGPCESKRLAEDLFVAVETLNQIANGRGGHMVPDCIKAELALSRIAGPEEGS